MGRSRSELQSRAQTVLPEHRPGARHALGWGYLPSHCSCYRHPCLDSLGLHQSTGQVCQLLALTTKHRQTLRATRTSRLRADRRDYVPSRVATWEKLCTVAQSSPTFLRQRPIAAPTASRSTSTPANTKTKT